MIDRRTFLACSALAVGTSDPSRASSGEAIVELRQYTLFGGQRDVLIDLFEREFVQPQDEVGAQVLGTFRDLDDPDRFVWLRGFAGMEARREALTRFYTGPAWRAHRAAANATMKDSDNVLLLRPVGRDPEWRGHAAPGLLTINIHDLGRVDPEAFAAFFDITLRPRLVLAGAEPIATLVTEPATNTFPALPVREGDSVFAWFAWFPDERAERAAAARAARFTGWRDSAPEALLPALARKPERLRLHPTATSKLR